MSQTHTLPDELPLFPLGGAILLPEEVLPLNVFEPRYLNMLDDVRAGAGHIGIIQTVAGASGETPALKPVGAAGRLTGFRETEDGRYLITLVGVSRFRLVEELDALTPYRLAKVDYAPFANDLVAPDAFEPDRTRLTALLQAWLGQEGVEADWESVAVAPFDRVVNQLAMAAPFASAEKQSLLEAEDLRARFALMEELIAARLADQADGPPQ